jgi:protein O-mannosyl-transferase
MSRRAQANISRQPGPALRPGPASAAPGTRPEPRWQTLAVAALLVLAVWFVFGQTRHHEFVNYDDNLYVYENPAITNGLNWPGVARAFTHKQDVNWHPLTTLSHMLDCQLYGLNPGGHHLTSVFIHAAGAVLLFLMLRELTGAFWRSAAVAAVFAIHPLRVESVAWVAERKDVLSGLFFMLTLWAYARYVRWSQVQGPKSKVWYGLTLAAFAGGLMSKPMLVTLPFVLLLLDYWPLERVAGFRVRGPGFPTAKGGLDTRKVWQLFQEKIPFLMLAAAACAVTVLAQQEAIQQIQDLPFRWRIGNALVAYVDYLGQLLWPTGLAVLYLHPGNHLAAAKIVFATVVLLAISAGVVAGRKQYPYLPVGWLWYLGMLVPVIGLMQVGSQARADRYTYLPQIGLVLLLVWWVTELCGSWRHRRAVLGCAAAAAITALMVTARVQAGYWQDGVTLWTHTLACTRNNSMARNNLGIALADRQQWPEAIEQYQAAFQLSPDYAEPHYNLGVALAKLGRLPEAAEQYRWTLRLDPAYAKAHINLGNVLKSQGQLAEAVDHYQQALRLNPDSAEACLDLGNALAAQGQPEPAILQYRRALQLNPNYAEAHFNWGNTLAARGRMDEALQHYEQAIRFNPGYAKAHLNLGNALSLEGKLADAVEHYQLALQFNPDDPDTEFDLGNTYRKQGKPEAAIPLYERLLQVEPDNLKARLNLGGALAATGNLPQAGRQFAEALRRQPDSAEAHLNLGNVLRAQGKLEEARTQFQQAIDLATAQHNPALAEAARNRLAPATTPPASH